MELTCRHHSERQNYDINQFSISNQEILTLIEMIHKLRMLNDHGKVIKNTNYQRPGTYGKAIYTDLYFST